jgi:hypothetical protein
VIQLDLFQQLQREPEAGGVARAPVATGQASAGAPPVAAGDAGDGPEAGRWLLHGSREVEAALLRRLNELAAAARRDPRALALPVRVVVPSRSLRRHVAARLVRGAGAVAGVVVQTLHGVACEVLERAGQAPPRGELLFATLVERVARTEPLLRRGLGDLEDGFLTVAAAVADLLDAGLEPEHAPAADEALAAEGPRTASRVQVEWARAVVRVAVAADREMGRLGLGRRSTLLRQAVAALAAAPEEVLPARAILLHGFVAAGGAAADLVESLLHRPGALLLLDQPPVPGAAVEEIETAATSRLAERAAGVTGRSPAAPPRGSGWNPGEGYGGFRGAGGPGGVDGPGGADSPGGVDGPGGAGGGTTAGAAASPRERDAWSELAETCLSPAPPRLAAFSAAGTDAEAREVARRLRELLDGGARRRAAPAEGRHEALRPEDLAVVARDFDPYRVALRRHLHRLGVPFSGVGEKGGLLPSGRRSAAVLDLLRLGPEAPADRWLDACQALPAEVRVELGLAWRALGAARLRDVAALRGAAFAEGYALPVREGLRRADPAPGGVPAGLGPGGAPAADRDTWSAEAAAGPPPGVDAEGAYDAAGSPPGADAEGAYDAAGPPPGVGAEGAGDAEDGDGRSVAPARRIAGPRLRQGIEAAAATLDRLAGWPRRAPLAAHLAQVGALLADLGLADDPAQPLASAAAELAREVPGDLVLGAEELRLLLARVLGDAGRCALGGAGGGVQLLSVAEARGRTFEHLFLLGLNRGVFPRQAREDPLLPDDLRQVLQVVLPDLSAARDAAADERHALAQLLSAAPAVCLSWRSADDDGKPLAVSPLAVRALGGGEVAAAPAVYAAAMAGMAGMPGMAPMAPMAPMATRAGMVPRPADEHAVLAGLRGSRRDVAGVLPVAVREMRRQWGRELLALEPAAVAAARLAILAEQDPDLRTAAGRAAAAGLGPYFGFVGAVARRGSQPLYVTHLEGLAACPWQLFLGRVLRVERPPEPLGDLPGAEPLRLGNLVHRVLDRLVKRALAAAGAPSRPVAVRWPADEELASLLVEAAAAVLAEDGLVLPGLARALATHARPFVVAVRDVDWPAADSEVMVVASETQGELRLPGHPALLRFRADREDLVAGRRRFTDYKTGRPLAAGTPAKRREKLLAEVAAGRRLQAVAYLEAAGPAPAVGRYLFLSPEVATVQGRAFEVDSADAAARAAFGAAASAALAAWESGSFFPRLTDPAGRKEPARCGWCELAEACLRGDSGARRRLTSWTAHAGAGPPPTLAAEAALLAVWQLETEAEEPPAAVLDATGGAVPEPAAGETEDGA